MLLGDMGAEVIKVERLAGDDGRNIGPYKGDVTLYAPTFNRNKKSVTVNFRSEEGKDILKKLISVSDVLVENFRPGTMEKMGLSYDEIKQINPGIIVASISGYGQTGPFRERACFDVITQAISGLMSVTGSEETGPFMVGTPIVDHTAGIVTALGIMMALYDRIHTGKGQYIDTSMMECMMPMLQTNIPDYGANGKVVGLHGNTDLISCPADCYKAKDGYVMLHAGTDPLYKRLIDVMGLDVLKEDRFSNVANRNAHKAEIEKIVSDWISEKKAADVEQMMCDGGLPCAVVANIEYAMNNPQSKARKSFVDIEVPGVGMVPFPANPLRFSDRPVEKYDRTPELGENNIDVYKSLLHISDEAINDLKKKGAI